MDSQSSHDQDEEERRLAQHLSRAEIRYLINDVVCELMEEQLLERQQQRGDGSASSTSSSSLRRRLNKKERQLAKKQTTLIEHMVYRSASCMKEYQDLYTLEDRAIKARHALCVRFQSMQRARRTREQAVAAVDECTQDVNAESNMTDR